MVFLEENDDERAFLGTALALLATPRAAGVHVPEYCNGVAIRDTPAMADVGRPIKFPAPSLLMRGDTDEEITHLRIRRSDGSWVFCSYGGYL